MYTLFYEAYCAIEETKQQQKIAKEKQNMLIHT